MKTLKRITAHLIILPFYIGALVFGIFLSLLLVIAWAWSVVADRDETKEKYI